MKCMYEGGVECAPRCVYLSGRGRGRRGGCNSEGKERERGGEVSPVGREDKPGKGPYPRGEG